MKFRATTIALTLLLATATSQAAVVMSSLGGTYTQNFDSLASTGTSATVPEGWAFLETGSSANTTYAAGTGSNNAGDTYSFGAAGSADRAFGTLRSGNVIPSIGASFTNATGRAVSELVISYVGETWRAGTVNHVDRLDFQISFDATSLSTGIWSDLNALDYSSNAYDTLGAKDGNAAGNRSAISSTITGLNIGTGSTFWIRWTDFDATGADDGLGIDDFALTVPEPGSLALVGLALLGMGLARTRSTRRSR